MPPKKKAANGYKHAEPLPAGTVLQDIAKKRWKLGPSIGKGGFGEIYSAQEESAGGKKYPFVVKIEPHSNGPLFVEINFYIRCAKPVDVDTYKKEKKLKTFGMPIYHGSGSHEYNGEKYRFLIMDKFSSDLYTLHKENKKRFPLDTVFKVAIQMLDVLEYIHSCGYVHADLKGANILLGATKETQDKQCYLVDFGLATKFTVEAQFKPNPKKAHDGTIEYLSRDAHQGVQTRRGDLEILFYNMLHWLGCDLPWDKKLTDPKVVQTLKEDQMPKKILKTCFVGDNSAPKALKTFLDYLVTLNFNTEPDYGKIGKIFAAGVKEGGGTIGSILNFKPKSKSTTKKATSHIEEDISSDDEVLIKRISKPRKVVQKIDDEEDIENDKKKSAPRRKVAKKRSKSVDSLKDVDKFDGFTDAMKEMWKKKQQREATKKRKV